MRRCHRGRGAAGPLHRRVQAGAYRLEVRALFGNNGEGEVREGRLGAVLTVS